MRQRRTGLGSSAEDVRTSARRSLRVEYTSAVLGTASQNISILMSPTLVWRVTDIVEAVKVHGTKTDWPTQTGVIHAMQVEIASQGRWHGKAMSDNGKEGGGGYVREYIDFLGLGGLLVAIPRLRLEAPRWNRLPAALNATAHPAAV